MDVSTTEQTHSAPVRSTPPVRARRRWVTHRGAGPRDWSGVSLLTPDASVGGARSTGVRTTGAGISEALSADASVTTIPVHQAIRQLVAFCPAFAFGWSALVMDPANRAEDGELVADSTARSVVRHLAVMSLAGRRAQCAAAVRGLADPSPQGCTTPAVALVERVRAHLLAPLPIAARSMTPGPRR